jgi:hypothetical protein
VVLRFRAAHGVERQQLRWVAAGATATVAAICVMVPVALSGVASAVPAVLFPLASLCVPVAVAVAMLRHRLWDLDRLVSRTVRHLRGCHRLARCSYLRILPAVTRLAGDAGSLAVAGATLAAAAALPRCAAGSRTWSTAASTGAASAPPAPWPASPPTCASRSTWTLSRASCWPWSTRPSSRPGCGCGCTHRRPRSYRPGQAMLGLQPDTLSGPEAKPGHRPPPIASYWRDQRCSGCRRQRCCAASDRLPCGSR